MRRINPDDRWSLGDVWRNPEARYLLSGAGLAGGTAGVLLVGSSFMMVLSVLFGFICGLFLSAAITESKRPYLISEVVSQIARQMIRRWE